MTTCSSIVALLTLSTVYYQHNCYKSCKIIALFAEQSPSDQLVPTVLVEIMTNADITPSDWITITGEITSYVEKVIAKSKNIR